MYGKTSGKGSDNINNINLNTGRRTQISRSLDIPINTKDISFSKKGLTRDEVIKMREKYGTNKLSLRKSKSFLSRFISNFNDPIIKILLGALCLNVIFSFKHSNWPETIGVAVAVLIATLVSTVSEYSSCRAAERLSEGDNSIIYVRRDGQVTEVRSNDIVVGDVVLLSPGMKIPADGMLLSGELRCNQSAITGEGKDIKKIAAKSAAAAENYINSNSKLDADNNILVLKGSIVTSGNGEFIVLRTGDKTLYGEVAAELREEPPESPLKRKLSVLAGDISFIGYIAAAMVAVSYLFNVFFIDSGMEISVALAKMKDMPFLFHELLSALTLGVSVLVVAVPEGLPMMITVVLSSNMKKMLRHGVLVKKMVGIETAGSMSILFTDKTGTLTEGRMALKSILTHDGKYVSASSISSKKQLYSALYNASVHIPIEGAVNFADEAAREFFGIKDYSRNTASRIPFRSENRFAAASVICEGNTHTYVRGAPEIIFERSARYMADNGDIKEFDNAARAVIIKKWNDAAEKGGRVIASAYTDTDFTSDYRKSGIPPLIFCGLLVFEDRLRKDAARSVKEARDAGIKTIMMTGDNKITATAIAKECGILYEGEIVLTGDEISMMSDSEIISTLPKISVIARALPSHKLRLVKLAREAGFISGMTGDGINDAPSLRAADVGFAMGSGTDVTKEAGDIVITNNSFSSIIRAVLYGRTIFRSIRKFIIFQLTMNLCATAVSFIGPFVGIESPVTIIQMLWVNIIMDTLGALAFAGEPPSKKYMKLPPLPSDVKILTKEMIFGITLTGSYMVFLSMYFLLSQKSRSLFGQMGDTYFLTAFFAFFIFCGIYLSFNARTPKLFLFSEIGKNKLFIFIMTAVAVIQLMLVYFGGEMFRCTPLLPYDLIRIAGIASTVIPVGAVIKLLNKNRERDL
ncbi:MAG: calcium-translocating P-type ATPase, PMCA-type [Ruminococcaceae bacterium]|nr:calcium-translocating P-type ATPase, PMCA-type [Oscillospiraceae bacterium]